VKTRGKDWIGVELNWQVIETFIDLFSVCNHQLKYLEGTNEELSVIYTTNTIPAHVSLKKIIEFFKAI
jgi:hypothetical protein